MTYYNVTGSAITTIYNILGGVISAEEASTLPHMQLEMLGSSLTDLWKSNCESAYDSMKEYYESTENSIPFFITTDQHGDRLNANRYVNNIDTLEIANLAIGDYCTDRYNTTQMSNLYFDSKWIANIINTVGNHDKKIKYDGMDVDIAQIKKSFMTDSRRFSVDYLQSDEYHNYCSTDETKGVKWLVFDNYKAPVDATTGSTHISTDVYNWIITQLTKEDYDIVFVAHQEFTANFTDRDSVDSGKTDADATMKALWDVLMDFNARKSGTFTDDDGMTHSYDFSSYTKKILCSLHGHWHHEMWKEDTYLTAYAGDCHGYVGWSTFGVIDRTNNVLKIYAFDETDIFDTLTINI